MKKYKSKELTRFFKWKLDEILSKLKQISVKSKQQSGKRKRKQQFYSAGN